MDGVQGFSKKKTEPQLELTLRAVFGEGSYDRVCSLLRATCPEEGYLEEFKEWERAYKRQDDQSSVLRFRENLLRSREGPAKEKRVLKYVGRPDNRVQNPCQKCSTVYVAVDSHPLELISALGFVLQFQFIRIGRRFVTSDGYEIEVYRIERIVGNNPAQSVPVPGGIVEVCSVITPEKQTAPEDLINFASFLVPTVTIPGVN